MKRLEKFCISVDGLPHAGKSTVCQYLRKYSQKYMVVDGGIVSSATVARCAEQLQYDFNNLGCFVVVYLVAAKEDIEARASLLPQQYGQILAEMNATAQQLEDHGVKVLVYNTSQHPPYLIAKDILKELDSMNEASLDQNGEKPAQEEKKEEDQKASS